MHLAVGKCSANITVTVTVNRRASQMERAESLAASVICAFNVDVSRRTSEDTEVELRY